MEICRCWQYYVDCVPVDLIENIRLRKVYKPKVVNIMSYYEFSAGWRGNTEADKEDAPAFIKRWNITSGI